MTCMEFTYKDMFFFAFVFFLITSNIRECEG